jgi:hypothetical protein
MKERPILFSTPMVQAILALIKSMTRRTKGLEEINKNPDDWRLSSEIYVDKNGRLCFKFQRISAIRSIVIPCPYGKVGDALWVKETHRPVEQDFGSPRYEYKATETVNISDKWKPSLFMPKEAARIWLEITGVKVERVQDICEEDALAEGINEIYNEAGEYSYSALSKEYHHSNWLAPEYAFQELWQKINGIESWNENPFVWCISFKQIQQNKVQNVQVSDTTGDAISIRAGLIKNNQ